MPTSMTTVNAITKEIYQGKIQNQLQDEAVGWKRIEKTSEGVESQVGGKYVTFPLRVRRNTGIGYRNELEQLMPAGQQGYASVRVSLKYGYGRLRLSGQVMDLADSNYQAFASAMDQEMQGLKNDIAKDMNRIFYGDGLGTLARWVSGTSAMVVDRTTFTDVGKQVDVVDSATGASIRVSNAQITAVNTTTNTITLSSPAVTPASGDIVIRYGDYGREPYGLAALVTSTGSLFNLDPATEPTWAAIVDTNGNVARALSEALMIKMTDAVRVNGGRTSLILTSLGVRRAYFNLLTQQRRYVNTTSFTGGLTGLAFNNGREIPVVEDVDCPPSTMYGLDESVFKIYRDHDWEWMNQDGNTWKWVTDFDAYEAVLNSYWQLGLNRRNANWMASFITEA